MFPTPARNQLFFAMQNMSRWMGWRVFWFSARRRAPMTSLVKECLFGPRVDIPPGGDAIALRRGGSQVRRLGSFIQGMQ